MIPRKNRLSALGPLLVVLLALLAAGCTTTTKKPLPTGLVRVEADRFPAFIDDMDYTGIAGAVEQSLKYLNRVPKDRMYTLGKEKYSAAHMIRTLTRFRELIQSAPSADALARSIRAEFILYRSSGKKGSGEVLFTGYYEPSLNGSPTRSERYRYPLLKRPEDLIAIDISRFGKRFKGEKRLVGRVSERNTVVPYFERSEIGPDFKGSEPLAWVDDRVDLFFLEIQGSGKVFLDDGTHMKVHYDTSNGRAYRSIGGLLIRENKLTREEVSLQTIKAYLNDHPEEVDRVLNYNESFVFFREETGGPYGCLGVPLTPGRSLATDRKVFPPAALLFIQTQKPLVDGKGNISEWRDLTRFCLNQDTGGAIRGPGRADLFWGDGQYAEIAAGHMKHKGELFILVLKP